MSNPGDLDTTFGNGGLVTSDFGINQNILSTAIQTDGKIVTGGYIDINGKLLFGTARYDTNGYLDLSFGIGGVVTTDLSGSISQIIWSVKIQSTGKIVVGGWVNTGKYLFCLARYNTNGTLDTSFGINGLVTTDFPDSTEQTISSICIQSNDYIVAGGYLNTTKGVFGLARYNSEGILDNTFGTGGLVITDFYPTMSYNQEITSISIQSNGKIIAAGIITILPKNLFIISCYNSNGTIDTNFGTNGFTISDCPIPNGGQYLNSITIKNNGKIIAGGYLNSTKTLFAIAQYNNNGILDTNFGISGWVTSDCTTMTNNGQIISSTAIQSNDKIVAGGYLQVNNGVSPNFYFVLARYNIDGSLDTTFGINGWVTTDYSFTTNNQQILSISLQSDGKIIAGGYSCDNNGIFSRLFALARYIGDPEPNPPICFPAGTPVLTDQGYIAIEKLDKKINTIRGKKIMAITRSVPLQEHIVLIQKDALHTNTPSKDTYISQNHKVLYKGVMTPAVKLVGKVEGVYKRPYNKEVLYNVVLKTHDKMVVNNMIVETLHPENIVAKLFTSNLSDKYKNELIVRLNKSVETNYKKEFMKIYNKL